MTAAGEHARASIRPAGVSDAGHVAGILADAFHDDPVMNWNLGSRKPIRTLFHELARGEYLKSGFGHVAGDEAATLWLRAGDKAHLSFAHEFRIGLSVIAAGGVAAAKRLTTVAGLMASARPSAPHYYLFAVGVRRRAQGKGYGGRLIAEGLKLADAANAPAYLECSNPANEPLYRRLGFERRSFIEMPKEAPPLSTMWRKAVECV